MTSPDTPSEDSPQPVEANPLPESSFIFVVCQAGAQTAAKDEVMGPKLNLAYSQPGFVTFKSSGEPVNPKFVLPYTIPRTYGVCLGRVQGEGSEELIDQILGTAGFAELLKRANHVHVFQRETYLPGDKGFEPGISAFSSMVADLFRSRLEKDYPNLAYNQVASPDQLVVDIIVDQPNVWWSGYHHVLTPAQRWVGGVPKIDTSEEKASRAYFKLKEALLWAGVKIKPGDQVAEIGSSPGGACELLLELGAKVLAVDPAEMEPEIAKHENLTYVRARGREVKKKQFANVKWLMVDLNAAPAYTLDTITDIVTHQSVNVSGMLLTLKLSDWKLVKDIPEMIKRVKAMGFKVVRCRQLAFNRREFCLFAAKDKFALRSNRRS